MAAIWSLRQLFAADSKENVQETDTESAGEMLEIGDFRIDTRRHTATLRGEPLELTGEEFEVLVFLTSNPQRVVTPPNNAGDSLDRGKNPPDPISKSPPVVAKEA